MEDWIPAVAALTQVQGLRFRVGCMILLEHFSSMHLMLAEEGLELLEQGNSCSICCYWACLKNPSAL